MRKKVTKQKATEKAALAICSRVTEVTLEIFETNGEGSEVNKIDLKAL